MTLDLLFLFPKISVVFLSYKFSYYISLKNLDMHIDCKLKFSRYLFIK